MTTAVFNITDGTTRINLLEIQEGIAIDVWRQVVNQLRAGGTFQESSLADGRRLVDTKYAHAIEEIPFKIGQPEPLGSQDASILVLHKLFALLIKGSQFWATDWQQTPVYLEKRAECETNIAYAQIVTGSIPRIDDIFATGSFASGALMEMFLVIERGHWLATVPGTGATTEIFNSATYDGRSLGRAATTTNEVFVANKHNVANLSDIYTWSAANGFSANLMDAALPYDLIDSVGVAPQVNDYVIFGIDSALANSGVFMSLIFDIGTAGSGLGFVWERWTGAVWVAVAATDIRDNTDTGGEPLDTTGVNSVVFTGTTTQNTAIINGITAYWIRLRITSVGAVTIPTQQNRDIYSGVLPYVEITSSEIGGNIPALALLKLYSQTDTTVILTALRRVIVGLRSSSRGSNFTPYLNCSDEQNPANVAVAITGGASAFFDTGVAPSGRVVSFFSAAPAAMASQFTITISAPLTAEYYGKFRAYLRLYQVSPGAGTAVVQVVTTISSGGQSVTSPQTLSGTVVFRVADLSVVELPLSPLMTSEIIDEIVFDVQVEAVIGPILLQFVDLILMPTDEWAADVSDFVVSSTSNAETGERLTIDSIANPKSVIRTQVANVSTGYVKTVWQAIKNGPAILQRDTAQRLWFTIFSEDTSLLTWDTAHLMSVQIEKQQRYLGPRGAG